jgi:hypothetical protein
LLGTHVAGRPEDQARLGECPQRAGVNSPGYWPGVERLRQPEVEEFYLAVRRQLDVGGLEVAVNNALRVRGFECLGYVSKDRERFFNTQGVPRESFAESLARHQLHHQQPRFTYVLQPMDGRYVRVIERGEHARFAFKALEAAFIAGEVRGYELDGNIASEPRIASAIDLAHPALSEEVEHLVVTKRAPGDNFRLLIQRYRRSRLKLRRGE